MASVISHKMNLQASSRKIFLLKLIVQEIESQMTKINHDLEMWQDRPERSHGKFTYETELEFLHDMLSKYEKKLDEARNDDKLLVNSEVEKLTVQMQELDINK